MDELQKRFVSWLSRITYKPNVRIKPVFQIDFFAIEILVSTTDSGDQGKSILIGHPNSVSRKEFYRWGFDNFVSWVWRNIREMELHEMDEFFKVDGCMIFNPHQKEQGA